MPSSIIIISFNFFQSLHLPRPGSELAFRRQLDDACSSVYTAARNELLLQLDQRAERDHIRKERRLMILEKKDREEQAKKFEVSQEIKLCLGNEKKVFKVQCP